MYLEKINSPQDLNKLNKEELKELAKEMRDALIKRGSIHGGHFGPNLGMVEMTIALHYVFNSPVDKIVYDVSHQCYPHKMLTGRKDSYLHEEKYDDITGYTNPIESEHDFFTIGHTSTSISLASGLAKARDLLNKKENIIAIIGDGSLSGGEALEGLDFVPELDSNMIVIVNDNDQSIAENHGGIYKNLKELRESDGKCDNNMFKAIGYDYYYLEDGHNIENLIELFEKVKDTNKAVLLHIHTIKGKGYKYAEEDRELWHASGPFNEEDGTLKFQFSNIESYNSITNNYLTNLLETREDVVAITAGTPMVMGFTEKVRPNLPKGKLVDVGIAEEHAVAMASGIAKNGGTPIFGVFSPFLQRTYDQISSDLCLNNNPAIILVYLASVYGMNSNTHLGIFDIPMLAHIPNLVYLAPTSKEEHIAMLNYATTQKEHPIAIRMPVGELRITNIEDKTDYSILNKYEVTQKGSDVAIIGLGNFYSLALDISKKYKEETGKELTLINPKFITGVDEKLLNELRNNHKLIITLEDGIIEGGFGQTIASFYGTSGIKVKNYGIKKSFPTDFKAEELLKENGISTAQILSDIRKLL